MSAHEHSSSTPGPLSMSRVHPSHLGQVWTRERLCVSGLQVSACACATGGKFRALLGGHAAGRKERADLSWLGIPLMQCAMEGRGSDCSEIR
jgi:hypothetical protein